ncbi:hypothetical protein LMG24238_02077 [Paraburkholderia sediminicola]|uniref:Uncharacterized protein n=1 Tax=Paraburkholderia sediminicola TaxID=458836 RepID=A0A6J5AJE3_9BURK|nr:hypothetical protein LMG24238_02077 [Paraburkholderia sediminicola]
MLTTDGSLEAIDSQALQTAPGPVAHTAALFQSLESQSRQSHPEKPLLTTLSNTLEFKNGQS